MNVTVLVDGSAVNSKIRTGIVPPDVPALRSLPLLIQTSSTTPDPGRWLHLHCSNLNNFRPISKRPFSARILEKVLAEQPLAFLHWNSILEKFQCGFRKDLNTENAWPSPVLFFSISVQLCILLTNVLLDSLASWVGTALVLSFP